MSPVPVTIRHARLDDAAAITRIHRSHVPQWYRKTDGEHCEAGYDALTLDERCGFGGPWMSLETCAIHLNNLLLCRHMPFVAEVDGEPVAEMELFVGREGEPYGKTCHIGLLYVHKDHAGQGIGHMLVEKAMQYARESRCDTLTVSSAPATEMFYRKCGFSFGKAMIEIEAVAGEYHVDMAPLPPPASLQSFTWGMDMKIGRLQSSAFHVFEMSDQYALPSCRNAPRHTRFMNVNGHPAVLSCDCPASGNAVIRGWSSGAGTGDLVLAALNDINARGIHTAHMLLSRKDYDHIYGLIEARLIGSRLALKIKV